MGTTTLGITAAEFAEILQGLANTNLQYLAISVSVLVLMGGAFYLFNFRPLQDSLRKHEERLALLQKEVDKNLADSKRELREEIIAESEKDSARTLELVDQKATNLLSEVEAKLAISEKETAEKINSVSAAKDTALQTLIMAEVQNLINKAITDVQTVQATSQTETTTSLRGIRNSIKELSRRIKKVEVFRYSQKGQMGAIIGAIELLKEAIDENSWEIQGSLEALDEEIGEYKLEASEITDIEKQLTRLSEKPEYNVLVKKIRAHYDK